MGVISKGAVGSRCPAASNKDFHLDVLYLLRGLTPQPADCHEMLASLCVVMAPCWLSRSCVSNFLVGRTTMLSCDMVATSFLVGKYINWSGKAADQTVGLNGLLSRKRPLEAAS